MKSPALYESKIARRIALGFVSVCGLFLALLGTGAGSKSPADLLNGRLLLDHVRFLASDELAGRGNGTAGLEEAARYIAERFREYGLRPAGTGGSYFQPFPITLGGELGPANRLRLEGVGVDRPLRVHEDFEPLTFTGSGTVEAPIVFVGHGITAPEQGYDDYKNVDVQGKVALLLRHVPGEGRDDAPIKTDSDHATFVSKAVNAKAHRAVGLILVSDTFHHRDEPDELLKFGEDLGAEDLSFPAIHVKRELAEMLFRASGRDLPLVEQAIDENMTSSSFPLAGVKAEFHVDVTRTRAEVRNVLGYVPPAGGKGGEELLIIGGHYDHIGLGRQYSRASQKTRGQIHNGADDNASGTAGVLELARVFASRADLKRGILFAAFAGEELGLLGSAYYTENPTLPLEKTVAMLNLDMVGRMQKNMLYIGGVGTSPIFRAKFDELGAAENLSFSYSFSGYGSSDHTSFTLREIPSLFFFTGLHGDYHMPSDDWKDVNAKGAEQVLRVVYQMSDHIQSLSERPAFVRSAKEERKPTGGGGGYGAYFGSVPDFAHEGKGVRFAGVREESPAEQAGFLTGDILIEFDGRPVDNLYDFTDVLRRHKPGDEVSVKVLRDGKTVEARVKLGRRP